MKYWNISDEPLLRVLLAARIDGMQFTVGRDGGVAVYWRGYFLGVWVEFKRSLHDFVPAAHLKPTFTDCTRQQAVVISRGLAADAEIHVPAARAIPPHPKWRVIA